MLLKRLRRGCRGEWMARGRQSRRGRSPQRAAQKARTAMPALGLSLFLIAFGAILAFAVKVQVSGLTGMALMFLPHAVTSPFGHALGRHAFRHAHAAITPIRPATTRGLDPWREVAPLLAACTLAATATVALVISRQSDEVRPTTTQ